MKKREGQPNLDFENEPKPTSILDSPEFKRARETVDKNAMEGKAEDELRKTVYSQLSPKEQEEHDNLKTPTEKREYIVRKYSKIFGPPSD